MLLKANNNVDDVTLLHLAVLGAAASGADTNENPDAWHMLIKKQKTSFIN